MPSLRPWKDLSPGDSPRHAQSSNAAHILVIGAGVIGLTTAWALLDNGYRVTVVSKEWASFNQQPRLTSQIAGALWEYPPAVCGQHTDVVSLTKSKRWCMVSYHIFSALANPPSLASAVGIRMKPATFFFPRPIADTPDVLRKIQELTTSGVRGFSHGPGLIRSHSSLGPSHGAVDAFQLLSPVIDTDVCMAWLTKLVQSKGATLHTETITGDLFTGEAQLRRRFHADAIVNATGLGASDLANDHTCYPIRGALIRLLNDGTDFPKIDAAMAVPVETDPNLSPTAELIFLVPRNDHILLLGGIVEPHEGELDLTPESPVIRRMRARCEDFLPGLQNARVDPDYPLAQGLRPFRGRNIRVERELRQHGGKPSRIVHNYGHGGAGWSLCFGCAGDVLDLIHDALLDLAPESTASGFVEGETVAKL
ncbi:hypothetical protein ARAM_004652 [Aspergillus rambellii]|uniref:FAD dependent oxidoreductase domain-containing protein n=1 Tax=Aspergillus rambellii TaxID=308745 RepID=A0A0F8WUU6_9EURO|nr:hypothetical protein ARAM_004652 [Aspergillus rambellii]